MCGTQLKLVDVAPQALTNDVEVVKPIILARAKGHADVGQMWSRIQIMEYASKNNYDICVDSAHTYSLLPCLRSCSTWTTILVSAFSWLQFCTGMLSPIETITCPEVTYTTLAGGQLKCATLGISIAKFLLVH